MEKMVFCPGCGLLQSCTKESFCTYHDGKSRPELIAIFNKMLKYYGFKKIKEGT